jgi:ASC-1-like (ASCH) protein
MSKYEARLKSGDIFDYNFPEAKIICEEIDTAQYKTANSITDNELIETLLRKYHTCLDDLKSRFKHYEAHVEQWFNNLLPETKK